MIRRARTILQRYFTNDGFRGPVLTLLSGSSVALLLAYLAQPILTRLYPPEAFGVLDAFVSLMTLGMAVGSLRYEDALMQPEHETEAAGVLGSALLALGCFVLLCVLALPWRTDIAEALRVPGLAPWLLLFPAGLAFMRAGKLAELWLSRQRHFKTMSAGQVAGVGTMTAARLTAGFSLASPGAGGLIVGFVLGHLVSLLLWASATLRTSWKVLRAGWTWSNVADQARRYRRFALYTTPSSLLGSLLTRLPFLMILYFFSEDVQGYFGRAFLVLAIPLSFIGSAVANVFFVEAAYAEQRGELGAMTGVLHARLVLLGLYPTLALMLAGPDILAFFFGEPWRTAGIYLQVLAPWLLLTQVTSPLTRIFDVLERQRLELLVSLAMFAVLFAALLAGGRSGQIMILLTWLGLAGVLTRLVVGGVLFRLVGTSAGTIARPYLRYALMAAPGLVLLGGALYLDLAPWAVSATAAAGGLLYYALGVWRDGLLTVHRPA